MNQDHERTFRAASGTDLAIQRAKGDGDLTVKLRHYSDGSERRPAPSSGFRAFKFDPRYASGTGSRSISGWQRGGLFILSAHVLAAAPDGSGDVIPQWHVSMSKRRKGDKIDRPNDREVKQALACFGIAGAEEDNHEPGIARHFWMPVDPARRVDCECKATEVVHVEPDGHAWSSPVDECSGCSYETTMRETLGQEFPCTIHRPRSEPPPCECVEEYSPRTGPNEDHCPNCGGLRGVEE